MPSWAAIQREVQTSQILERYVLQLWAATDQPTKFGIKLDGVEIDRLVLAGRCVGQRHR